MATKHNALLPNVDLRTAAMVVNEMTIHLSKLSALDASSARDFDVQFRKAIDDTLEQQSEVFSKRQAESLRTAILNIERLSDKRLSDLNRKEVRSIVTQLQVELTDMLHREIGVSFDDRRKLDKAADAAIDKIRLHMEKEMAEPGLIRGLSPDGLSLEVVVSPEVRVPSRPRRATFRAEDGQDSMTSYREHEPM